MNKLVKRLLTGTLAVVKMWSNQENRVRKQVKNPCEARKIKASQNLHKIISTHLLLLQRSFCLSS